MGKHSAAGADSDSHGSRRKRCKTKEVSNQNVRFLQQMKSTTKRSFLIDTKNNQFLLNGENFQLISGEFQYFRSHENTWSRKLRLMRLCGLNTVSTCVDWALHNPREGIYNYTNHANIESFINQARIEGLFVMLNLGPYINSDRDNGCIPFWLLRNYPDIKLRTNDKFYMGQVKLWVSQLMRRLTPQLYGNSGNIIMIQIEDHYGNHSACNRDYLDELFSLVEKYVSDKAVLFTVDNYNRLRCGKIHRALATISLMPGDDMHVAFKALKRFEPEGPLVCGRLMVGNSDIWQGKLNRSATTELSTTLNKLLSTKTNFNLYMFCGGTNFGLRSGAHVDKEGNYAPVTTSYDFDAPINEAGNPTMKFSLIRELISKHIPAETYQVPAAEDAVQYGNVDLMPVCVILSKIGLKTLAESQNESPVPLTFEALDQDVGLVLYETDLPARRKDPSLLEIPKIHDRAYVYASRRKIGILSRQSNVLSLPIEATAGHRLQILVESQGRISEACDSDFKGIVGDVLLDGRPLKSWVMTKISMDFKKFENLTSKARHWVQGAKRKPKHMLRTGPIVLTGTLKINSRRVSDTYLDMRGWGKGIVFINGFNLGRYWPLAGPQLYLFVPRDILIAGRNIITVLEFQLAPKNLQISFGNEPLYESSKCEHSLED